MILAGTVAIGTAGAAAAWWWTTRVPDTGPIPVIAFDATVQGAADASAAGEPARPAPAPTPATAKATAPATPAPSTQPPSSPAAADARVASVAPPRAAAQPAAATPASAPNAQAAQGAVSLAEACTLVTREPLRARVELTRIINSGTLSGDELAKACAAINAVNDTLLWSSKVTPGDLICTSYTVKKGDTLSQIAKRNDVQADWRVLMRINGLRNERDLRVGRPLKLPAAAFHAEVSKRDYRIYLYAGEGPNRVMVGAYDVGLGELDSTPTGVFMVRPRSKLINPEWRNPRTGEYFFPDDPKNPIGERWIGLVGVEQANSGIKGYGIHGTTDPSSIGQQQSMGCVRMLSPGLDIVYELLTEPNSTILIRP